MKRSIIIVEDDLKLREKFARAVNSEPDMYCAGTHDSVGEATLQMVKNRPDMIIINIKFLDMANIARFDSSQPFGAIVQNIFVMSGGHVECIAQALTVGINDRQVEPSFPDQLIQVIRNTDCGGTPMRAFVVLKLARTSHELGASPNEDKDLSPREQQIIKLLAMGFVSREIGIKLNISPETVRSHLKHIYKKLNVRNKIKAITKYRVASNFLDVLSPQSAQRNFAEISKG